MTIETLRKRALKKDKALNETFLSNREKKRVRDEVSAEMAELKDDNLTLWQLCDHQIKLLLEIRGRYPLRDRDSRAIGHIRKRIVSLELI